MEDRRASASKGRMKSGGLSTGKKGEASSKLPKTKADKRGVIRRAADLAREAVAARFGWRGYKPSEQRRPKGEHWKSGWWRRPHHGVRQSQRLAARLEAGKIPSDQRGVLDGTVVRPFVGRDRHA